MAISQDEVPEGGDGDGGIIPSQLFCARDRPQHSSLNQTLIPSVMHAKSHKV